MPSRHAQSILNHVKAARPILKVGGVYNANDDSGIWAISSHTLRGGQTGKLVLACKDLALLQEFIEAAREAGHTIENTGQLDTVIITPGK